MSDFANLPRWYPQKRAEPRPAPNELPDYAADFKGATPVPDRIKRETPEWRAWFHAMNPITERTGDE